MEVELANLSPWLLIVAPLVVIVAYVVFGLSGFGSTMVSVPILAHFLPVSYLVPLMVMLDLASSADLWYAGSGATLSRGAAFGYAGRRSNGSRRLGTSVEASADYAITPRVSINGFLGHMRGGPVVTRTFANGNLWFGYVESVVSVGSR